MNNKRKNFTYVIKISILVLWLGVLMIYVASSRDIAALFGAGIAVAAAAIINIITFTVLVARMTKDSRAKWQSYLNLVKNENVDYQEQLEQVRINFARDTKKNKNRIPKLNAIGIKHFYDYSVLERGKVYYGCIVQANNKLFNDPMSLNEVLPAVLIYSENEYYEQHPDELYPIAGALFEDKQNNILSRETSYFSNLRVPSEVIVGGSVYMTTVMIYRENLPYGKLTDWSVVPIIAQPNESTSVFILDSKYWTNDLLYKYTHCNIESETLAKEAKKETVNDKESL